MTFMFVAKLYIRQTIVDCNQNKQRTTFHYFKNLLSNHNYTSKIDFEKCKQRVRVGKITEFYIKYKMIAIEEIKLLIPKKVVILIMYFIVDIAGNEKNSSLIYILIWGTYYIGLTSYLDKEKGQLYFINKKCRHQNCYLTDNKIYFSDVRDFDVILFNAMTFNDDSITLPSARSINQRYVFMSDEPPAIHPVPKHYNGFFNLTWTYKLDSDTFFRYITIKNNKGEVIGPKRNTNWMDVNEMEPISEKIKQKFKDKHKAAIWVASHCQTPSQREEYVKILTEELNKYNLQIDIFGHCGNDNIDVPCAKGIEECNSLIESEYFFYLAFENAMSEDYVTEKLLTAAKHYTVPIIYGGADYTR